MTISAILRIFTQAMTISCRFHKDISFFEDGRFGMRCKRKLLAQWNFSQRNICNPVVFLTNTSYLQIQIFYMLCPKVLQPSKSSRLWNTYLRYRWFSIRFDLNNGIIFQNVSNTHISKMFRTNTNISTYIELGPNVHSCTTNHLIKPSTCVSNTKRPSSIGR